MNDILQAVSAVGFPIVCAGAMFWYMVNVQEKMRKTIEENTKVMERMYAVLDSLTAERISDV